MPDKPDRRGRPKTKMECFASIVGDIKIMLPVLVALLGGTVYGNSETVRRAIHGSPVPTPADVHSVGDRETQVNQALSDIVAKLKKHDEEISNLKGRDNFNASKLQSQIDDLKSWHD